MTASGDSLTCQRCGATYAPEHRFCGACGAELSPVPPTDTAAAPRARPVSAPTPDASDELDRLAGAPYELPTSTGMPRDEERDDALPYYIPPSRIVLLSLLSSGLYIFYWMYLSWRHYRDYTGEVAYPALHALTLLVPVYQFFRLHAHVRVYQELMEARGVPSTLAPLRSVGLFLVAALLFVVAWRMLAEIQANPMVATEFQQIGFFAASAARVGVIAWILWQVQSNVNRYWQHRVGMRVTVAPLSIVEILLAVLGIVNWIGWSIILIEPSLILVEPIAPTP